MLTASAINCVTFGEEFHSYILGEGDKSLIKVLCVENLRRNPDSMVFVRADHIHCFKVLLFLLLLILTFLFILEDCSCLFVAV